MKFGINLRKTLTGAETAVRVFQICSLLPLAYMLVASGYPYLFTHESLFSVLFDLGIAAIPRAEALGLSLLYRKSGSEIVVYFVLLGFALLVGLAAKALLKGPERRVKTSRLVWAVLIGLDLILRLIPLPFAGLAFYASALGFAVRLGCLALILLDLRAAGKNEE